jgi:hypothetical protein
MLLFYELLSWLLQLLLLLLHVLLSSQLDLLRVQPVCIKHSAVVYMKHEHNGVSAISKPLNY